MIVVLQRVSRGSVTVDGEVVGEIGRGHVLLVGFGDEDQARDGGTGPDRDAGAGGSRDSETMEDILEWMARKVVELRVFPDDDGRMNRSLEDVGGSILVISQFTLHGDTRKGRRPSFVHAADAGVAERLYDTFIDRLEVLVPGRVQAGEFGAMMDVALVNDGPVTLLLER